MGSGLSMASVNKIKELANAGEYGLALDILDSQDLTKSLNPQFLRLCGEVYMFNKRYKDARYVLLMAHRLAPQGKRVIYTLMVLYLKMGYMELAKQYYDIYMADADENVIETKQTMYIYSKAAEKMKPDDLEHFIAPTYSNTMDYDWTYETILLYLMQGRRREAEGLIQIYGATYKDSEYYTRLKSLVDNNEAADELFYTFADREEADDDPEQEESRELEKGLLAEDDLRINPREPEIVIMVDDNDDEEVVSKRKLKKMLREQERMEKEAAAREAAGQDNSDEGEVSDGEQPTADADETAKGGFFKGIFSKTKKKDAQAGDTAETAKQIESDGDKVDSDSNDNEAESKETSDREAEEKAAAEEKIAAEEAYRKARAVFFGDDDVTEDADTASDDSDGAENGKLITETAEDKEAIEDDTAETADTEDIEDTEDGTDYDTEDIESADEDSDMREIHMKKRNSIKNPIVTVDMGDDDFTAESDTIEDLHDGDFSNPFDSIVAAKSDDSAHGYKIKKSISFETAELADEDDDLEYEVDDFSNLSDGDDEFGEMKILEAEPEIEAEEEVEAEIDVEPEVEAETEVEEEAEEEIEEEIEVEAETEVETEVEEEAEEEIEAEIEVEPEVEAETEVEEEAEVEPEVEAETEVEEEVEEEPEIEAETEVEEEIEVEPEVEAETEVEEEVEEEIEIEAETEVEEEAEEEPEIEAETEVEPEIEAETEVEEEAEEEIEIEAETEVEEEPEIEAETEVEEEIEVEPEVEAEVEEEVEEEIEAEIEVEPEIEAETEVEEEAEEEPEVETEVEPEIEAEPEVEAEIEAEVEEETESVIPHGYTAQEIDDLFKVPHKKKLDYPVFRSSLFPDYHNEDKHEVENNFNEILQEAQDKQHDNIAKEEQMLREAEALLASLGIDMGDINAAADNPKDIKDTLNDGPSRDELKASLKINSAQKDILRKLKEYR